MLSEFNMSEMVELAERRRIAHEVYMITGVLVPEDDVLVLAALFYSRKLQEAASEAAGQLTSASSASRGVVDEAVKALRQAAADRQALADTISAQVKKAIRDAGSVQSTHESIRPDWRRLLAAMVFGAFFTGVAISVACNFSFSWVADARLGSQMKRAFPHFDPFVQDKIIQYFDKPKK
jgi:hypothetical protein